MNNNDDDDVVVAVVDNNFYQIGQLVELALRMEPPLRRRRRLVGDLAERRLNVPLGSQMPRAW